ncbi:MAG: NAD-dependent protein deacylase [Lachnospiraceae bacterium]|nr:NAD-dependent protein deacylase [Lachnospiraceae bacterium]
MKDKYLTKNAPFFERMDKLNDILTKSKSIAFLSGSGVSSVSGVPDIRSVGRLCSEDDGILEGYDYEYLLSHECLTSNPELFFRFYRKKMDQRGFVPNIVHRTLAEMEADKKLIAVITQNTDMLYEDAGIKNIYKLHGTSDRAHCTKCGATFPSERIYNNPTPVPCCNCGGMIRPDITLYEESLNTDVVKKAAHALGKADTLILCGTSMTMPYLHNLISKFAGQYMVMINNELTSIDDLCEIVFREDMRDVFEFINWKGSTNGIEAITDLEGLTMWVEALGVSDFNKQALNLVDPQYYKIYFRKCKTKEDVEKVCERLRNQR